MLFATTLFIGLICGRLLHFYCCMEQYRGLSSVFTDFSLGSFWLPASVAAIVPAAFLTARTYTRDDPLELLDACAPGVAFAIAMIRLSALFGTSCRSMIPVTARWARHLPFAVMTVDAAGNRTWHFATFFVMAILMLLVMAGMLVFYILHHSDKMRFPCPRRGNVAVLTLALICACEFVMDSTRADSVTFPFRFLQFLNPASSFVSLTQVVCAAGLVFSVAYYGSFALRTHGRDRKIIATFALFGVSLLFGGITEYLVQRYTTHPVLLYTLQSICALLMAGCVWLMYFLCRGPAYKGGRPSPEEL